MPKTTKPRPAPVPSAFADVSLQAIADELVRTIDGLYRYEELSTTYQEGKASNAIPLN